MRLLLVAAISILGLLSSRARADLQVSIVTFGPGEAVYERFGHVAIRVRDDAVRVDECFDWGNFDFDTPGFTWRFIKGDLNYWMEGGKPGQRMIDFYAQRQDRTVIEQTLNLSPQQTRSLVEALLANDTPANRFYRYDYYKDNCSTRVRDAIDAATNGAVKRSLSQPTSHSYRWQTRRLMPVGGINKLCETLSDMACGTPIDAPLSRWDESFIPTVLADQLDAVQLTEADGTSRPLVRERRLLHTTHSPENADPAGPWNPVRWTLPFALVSAGLMLALAWRGWRRSFRLLATAWEAWTLFAALFMTFTSLFTLHWAATWNENLLQFTPLSLLCIATLWIGRWRRPLRWAMPLSVALSVIGALVTISHLTPQRNAPAIALALPLHAAVMLGQRSIARGRPTDTAANAGTLEGNPT